MIIDKFLLICVSDNKWNNPISAILKIKNGVNKAKSKKKYKIFFKYFILKNIERKKKLTNVIKIINKAPRSRVNIFNSSEINRT